MVELFENSFRRLRIPRTLNKIHSADFGFIGLLSKFIPRTSDFAEFSSGLRNSPGHFVSMDLTSREIRV